jgi:hypothetical protein
LAVAISRRRGSTAQHAVFTGLIAEITVDLDKDTIVVHDGATVGGFPLAREDMSNVDSSDIAGALTVNSLPRNTLAVGSPNFVVINDGSGDISSEAFLAIARGGTGASTATGARDNLGLGDSDTPTFLGLSANGALITDVATPISPTDSANRQYVDDEIAGVNINTAVQAATTTDLDSVGNGTWTQAGAGIGATLTAGTAGTTTIDGVVLSESDRVLVKDQTVTSENGIYIATNTGGGLQTVLTRVTDMDQPAEFESTFTFVSFGVVNAAQGFVVTAPFPTVIDTDPVVFTQFTGAALSGGDGIDISGSTISVDLATDSGLTFIANQLSVDPLIAGTGLTFTAGVLDVDASQTQITAVGTVATGTWEATNVAVGFGGTGASNASDARTNLGVAIGTNVQAWDAGLDDVAGLAVTDGNFIVGNGTNWVAEAGNTARTSLGLGTGDTPTFSGLDAGGQLVTSVATPVSATDSANKNYVDSVASGLSVSEAADVATTVDLDSVGNGTWTQSGAGVGATLTAGTAGTTTIDGVALSDTDRVLVKNQTTTSENGVYVASDTGGGTQTVLTRATDLDEPLEFESAFFFVNFGTANGGTGWVVIAPFPSTVDTDPVTFAQFTGASSLSGGDGIDISGNVVSVDLATNSGLTFTTGQLTVNSTIAGTGLTFTSGVLDVDASQTQITAVGTLTTGTWNADTIAIANGGTGATTASGARTNLGVVIGTNVQAWDVNLDQIAGLTPTDSNFIVGNGSAWITETGNTARTSLGLGSTDTPTFNGLSAGSALITDVANPVALQDAATKDYVDTAVAGAGGGTPTYTAVNANTTASDGDFLAVDTTGSTVTIDLPPSPTAYVSQVFFVDEQGTFATNNLIVDRNGNNILGLAENLVSDVDGISFGLLFVGNPRGWIII